MTSSASGRPALATSVALGIATGIRSTSGFAILATASSTPSDSSMACPLVRGLLEAMLAGEAVADKLAPLPPRTDLVPLAGRLVLGGAASALAASWAGGSRSGAAVVGATSAAAGAWVATELRSRATDAGIPDWLPALVEDAVVAGLAAVVGSRPSR